MELEYPFYKYVDGKPITYYYHKYREAGSPFDEWDIKFDNKKAQLKFYDYMSKKYCTEICAKMGGIPAKRID